MSLVYKIKDWLNWNKDGIITILYWALALSIIGVIAYKNSHGKKELPFKNEPHCAQFIYFNSRTHTMDTTYSSVMMYEDSLVNITTPSGNVWFAKDFILNEDIIVDETEAQDITISNGERYKIITLDSGRCQGKSIMDSIRNTYYIDDREDYN